MTYTVIDPKGNKSHKTFEELNRSLGFSLDEAFFSPIFSDHVVETKDGKYMICKEKA